MLHFLNKFLKESFSWFVSLTQNMYIILSQMQKSCSISIMQRITLVCTLLLRAGQTGRIYILFRPFVLLCLLVSVVPFSFTGSLGELRRYLFLSFLSQKSQL